VGSRARPINCQQTIGHAKRGIANPAVAKGRKVSQSGCKKENQFQSYLLEERKEVMAKAPLKKKGCSPVRAGKAPVKKKPSGLKTKK